MESHVVHLDVLDVGIMEVIRRWQHRSEEFQSLNACFNCLCFQDWFRTPCMLG
jgi:hypothetical protein